MFPSISLFGFVSLSTQSLLLALGVLAALATAERLAARLHLRADRVWNAAALGGVSLLLGERLLLVVRGWRDFLAHPMWMLGLLAVRDQRLFYAGAGFGILVCAAYLLASRVSPARAADALLPAAGLLLAFVQAGYLAAGAEPGRVTVARWGLVSTNRVAHALYGTPLHVPLVPVAAYGCVGYAVAALVATWQAARGRSSAGFFLLAAGLLTVLLGQMELRWAGEPLLLGVFTWMQGAGVVSTCVGAGLLLRQPLTTR